MSPANRHPKAIVFHVALIVGLLLMHYWLAPPLLLTALLLLAAALWPWFTVWRAADDGATAADTPPAFSELTKNLSRNTCHNALSAAPPATTRFPPLRSPSAPSSSPAACSRSSRQ